MAAPANNSFNIVLMNAGFNKPSVIKAVMDLPGLGLKKPKELVDSVAKNVKTGMSKIEAEVIAIKLKIAGAEVEIT